jgi:hypothetical protein
MATLLSHPPIRRARHAETVPSVASLKCRWRRGVIDCRLPIRQRFELIVLLERAGGFDGRLSIAAAPSWAIDAGILRDSRGPYEFDMDWLASEEGAAERRWLEQHGAKRLPTRPMRSRRQTAEPAAIEPAGAQP